MASALRTLAVNILAKEKPPNTKAKLEGFADDFESLLLWLRKINFL